LGGLSKKAYQLQTERKNDPTLLTIDGGALLFKDEKIYSRRYQQLTTTAQGIVKAYNVMGYQSVGIARQDLGGGLDFLRKIQKKSNFPWLSANLVNKSDHAPIFTAGTLIKHNNLNVAILGLTGNGHDNSLLPPESNAVILPWAQVLPDLVSRFAKKADFMILLSNQPLVENQNIAHRFPQIHLIIQAGVGTSNLAPQRINNTLITQTEKQGKHIGRFTATWNQQTKKWNTAPNKELLTDKIELDRLTWQLARYRKKGDPEKVFKDKQNVLAAYRRMVKQENKLRQNIDGFNKGETTTTKNGADASTYQNRFLAMEKNGPDHPEVLAIVKSTIKEVNRIGKKILPNRAQNGSAPTPFIGSNKCMTCHEGQGEKWLQSKHARAYETLVNKEQQFNLKCIPCHITVEPKQINIGKTDLKDELLMVGCESCHGNGNQHAQSPQKNKLSIPAETVCLNCHTPDHDDDFDFKRDVELLQCGK
jgi:hypothetical protein